MNNAITNFAIQKAITGFWANFKGVYGLDVSSPSHPMYKEFLTYLEMRKEMESDEEESEEEMEDYDENKQYICCDCKKDFTDECDERSSFEKQRGERMYICMDCKENESDEWCECCRCAVELTKEDETEMVNGECICYDCYLETEHGEFLCKECDERFPIQVCKCGKKNVCPDCDGEAGEDEEGNWACEDCKKHPQCRDCGNLAAVNKWYGDKSEGAKYWNLCDDCFEKDQEC